MFSVTFLAGTAQGRAFRSFSIVMALSCATACSAIPGLEKLMGSTGNTPSGLVTVTSDRLPGLREQHLSTPGDAATSMRLPVVPGADPFTSELRTTMAERQTDFLTAKDGAAGDSPRALDQEAVLLAASPHALGARIVSRIQAGGDTSVTATTRWYDVRSGAVLPWTALLRGEPAIGVLTAQVADSLEEGGIAPERLPGGLREATTQAPDSEAVSTAPAPTDADAAWKLARRLTGSPLEDIGFDAAGNVVVSFSPGELPTADGTGLQVVLDQDDTEPLLSEFGALARTAATTDPARKVEPAAADPVPALDCDRVPCVALTFDDGPGAHTARLLEYLEGYSARATFYVLGELVGDHADLMRGAVGAGHEYGGHSWRHDDLTTLSGAEVAEDTERTSRAIEEIIGAPPRTMRPPYGSYNDSTREHVGLPMIMWDLDTRDWLTQDTAQTVDTTLSDTRPGSIVLLHDVHKSTVDAVPEILRGLTEKGYHFVTVSELFGSAELRPGELYYRRD
ncbi:polysaccharide deacetylase family protein [Marinactinospora thermotolerans]|uniref:Peptidoglycan/xylan/chitin deacetylase, PgdA/CDA1 family n=1 Tax=Marinactinospora thermotolerans DSM 45154 TaxID=1122192 RepID=A0A1T4P2U0_9ACTN|nr:polysaccharide deacetylase family protein [Marinactinospora thermotolerans]SJZ85920.1 Peptidoglycan/xylan/chitin deacetylase, PgdA/CDA1 family [Marinactinospora thermotolerans DSM 45154]